ncbi:hypothetical protein RRG08_044946 [Elysia crispata]|uniref:Uncharacterized protein n=1 Tax=Elysia crispata TaxID=231223 RepID=A0AAE0ZTQ6_9GAST|nr:hypothetical protein RRG08_044946 [Elysia crispata]
MDIHNTTFLQAFFTEYRTHNLDIKNIHSTNCSGGIQWAWLTFGECLLRPSHILGYWIGLFSSPLWVIGSLWSDRSLHNLPRARILSFLVLIMITDLLSLTGAVLSMQIMLLIIFGFVSVCVDCIIVVACVMTMAEGWRRVLKAQYVEVHNQLPEQEARPPAGVAGPSCWRCCVLGCVLLVSGLSSLCLLGSDQTLPVSGPAKLDVSPSEQAVTSPSLGLSQVDRGLLVTGYTLGCVACVGQLVIFMMGVRVVTQSEDPVDAATLARRPVCKDVLLLVFDCLYLVGVLLQSGGLRPLLLALPWIAQRLMHGSFQIYKLDNKRWLYSERDKRDGQEDDDDVDNDDDDDVILDSEDNKLLKSSGSEESRPCSVFPAPVTMSGRRRSSTSSRRLSEQAGPSAFCPVSVSRGRPRIYSLETTSTTESEMSSLSQIHDIELYRDRRCSIPRIVVHHSGSQSPTSRPNRLSLSGLRMSSINDTSPELHSQRVRSWVSQHTPEQEAVPPPSLTLTLNLDTSTPLNSPTTPDADKEAGVPLLLPGSGRPSNGSTSPCSLLGARLGHTLGALTMVPRKNSL